MDLWIYFAQIEKQYQDYTTLIFNIKGSIILVLLLSRAFYSILKRINVTFFFLEI